MVDHVDEARTGAERVRGAVTVTVELDAVSSAHLRALAAREGMTPDDYAARVVVTRLQALCDLAAGGGQ